MRALVFAVLRYASERAELGGKPEGDEELTRSCAVGYRSVRVEVSRRANGAVFMIVTMTQ